MECEVGFFGGVLEATGNANHVKVSFRGRTLGDLLGQIKKRWPKTSEYIDGPKSGAVVLILNGKSLEKPNPRLMLSSGDKLSIVHIISGG